MGATQSCTFAGVDCCGKDEQDRNALHIKDPAPWAPGLVMDLPIAAEQSKHHGGVLAASAPATEKAPTLQGGAALPDGSVATREYEADDYLVLPPVAGLASLSALDDEMPEAPHENTDEAHDLMWAQETDRTQDTASAPDVAGVQEAFPQETTGLVGSPRSARTPELPPPPTASPATSRLEAEDSLPSRELPALHEPPAPLPTTTGPQGLVVGFRLPDSSTKLVSFGKRKPPMGLDFAKEQPVSVIRVKHGGHAAQLGIEPSWLVISINGQTVEGWPCSEVMQKLTAAVAEAQKFAGESSEVAELPEATLPLPPIPHEPLFVLDFLLPDGSRKTVDFGKRKPPLGMDFDRAVPIKVKRIKAGGHGEALGVCAGWQITHINEVAVEGKSIMEVFHMMKSAMDMIAKSS